MEIAFETIELRNTCEDKEVAVSILGELIGSWLINRLADILAADNMFELPWNLEEVQLSGKPIPILVMRHDNGYRIGICANHVDNIRNLDKPVDWNRVKKIKLLQLD